MRKELNTQVNKILFEAHKKIGKLKHKTSLEYKYIRKLEYCLFFFRSIKYSKKFLDNWSLPDYRWYNDITRKPAAEEGKE